MNDTRQSEMGRGKAVHTEPVPPAVDDDTTPIRRAYLTAVRDEAERRYEVTE